jgi:hypothetical protein
MPQTSPLFQTQAGEAVEAARLLERVTGRAHGCEIDGGAVLLGSQSIDMGAIGTTQIVVAPATQDFTITALGFECTAAVSITIPAKARVFGTSGELCESQRLYGLTESGRSFNYLLWGANYVIMADDMLSVEITDPATGTSQTATFTVFGYAR